MTRFRIALALVTVGWLMAELLAGVFYFELYDLFDFFTWPVISLPLIAIGLALCVAAIVMTWFPSSRKLGLLVLLLVACVTCLQSFTQLSMEMGVHARLFRCEHIYLEQVENLAKGLSGRGLGSCGGAPEVDPGPPVRLVVPWLKAGRDWTGIVHDPSGTILALADKTNPDHSRVAGLFGGGLRGAAHIRGPWYFCWFKIEDNTPLGPQASGSNRSLVTPSLPETRGPFPEAGRLARAKHRTPGDP